MIVAPGTHLTYCLNIHPGERWEAQCQAVATHARMIKDAVSPRAPFGLGLRLGRQAADALDRPDAVARARRLFDELGMYAFTLNGFPYGVFHHQAVKADVYRPDWAHPERLEYTLKLARILAGWLPEGQAGSISTVPVSYRGWLEEAPEARHKALAHLAACAFALGELEERQGREIHLGLEPEPDCLLENARDTVAFFARELLPRGSAWLRQEKGMTLAAAEKRLRRHIGVCLDTCHAALQFERPGDFLSRAIRHGIRISKVQLSAALQTDATPEAAQRLQSFVDPVYLHQVRVRDAGGTVRRHEDLTPALLARWRPGGERSPREARVHFHVPLDFDGDGILRTSAGEITPEFLAEAMRTGVRHFEIETYSFGVLPAEMQVGGVEAEVIREFRWVLPRFAAAREEAQPEAQA